MNRLVLNRFVRLPLGLLVFALRLHAQTVAVEASPAPATVPAVRASVSATVEAGAERGVTGGRLVGHLYDFKQLAGSPPQPNPDLQTLEPLALAEREIRLFTERDWRPETLQRFFRSPRRVDATQIFFPVVSAEEAPRVFDAGERIEESGWVVHFRGRVSPPASGRFRFVGGCDDFLVVRLNGKIVLDGGIHETSAFASDRSSPRAYAYPLDLGGNHVLIHQRGGFVVGHAMDLRQDETYEIEILVGEGLKDEFFAFLFFEQEGGVYAKDKAGNPVLPIFRVADTPPPPQGQFVPPFQDNGPIWRAWPIELGAQE